MLNFADVVNPTVETTEIVDGKLVVRIMGDGGGCELTFEDADAQATFLAELQLATEGALRQ